MRPGFAAGFSSIGFGAKFLSNRPRLWPWSLWPVAVLAVLQAGFVGVAIAFVQPWAVGRLAPLGALGSDVGGWLLAAATAVLGWFVAVALAPPLSAPALERIVLEVERELGVTPRAPLGFFRELACGFRATLAAAAFGGPVLLVLWLAELFWPPAAVISVPLHVLSSSLLVAWSLFDYPLTLRGFGVRARLRLLGRNFGAALGFGCAFALAFWLPCCAVALLPVGAAAAARLTCELAREAKHP